MLLNIWLAICLSDRSLCSDCRKLGQEIWATLSNLAFYTLLSIPLSILAVLILSWFSGKKERFKFPLIVILAVAMTTLAVVEDGLDSRDFYFSVHCVFGPDSFDEGGLSEKKSRPQ